MYKILPIVPVITNSLCKICGEGFTCGIKEGRTSCWCFQEKVFIPQEKLEDAACLCPKCLRSYAEKSSC